MIQFKLKKFLFSSLTLITQFHDSFISCFAYQSFYSLLLSFQSLLGHDDASRFTCIHPKFFSDESCCDRSSSLPLIVAASVLGISGRQTLPLVLIFYSSL